MCHSDVLTLIFYTNTTPAVRAEKKNKTSLKNSTYTRRIPIIIFEKTVLPGRYIPAIPTCSQISLYIIQINEDLSHNCGIRVHAGITVNITFPAFPASFYAYTDNGTTPIDTRVRLGFGGRPHNWATAACIEVPVYSGGSIVRRC